MPTMPKRGNVSAPEVEPVAKKLRSNANFWGVVDAIKQAGLEPTTTKMLTSGLPGAFGVAKQERHAVQQKFVVMVEEVVESVRRQLQDAADAASSKVADLEVSRGSLLARAEEAEEVLATRVAEGKAKVSAKSQAAEKVQNVEASLVEKKQAQAVAKEKLDETVLRRDSFSKGVNDHFKPLLEGDFGVGSVLPLQKTLMPLLDGLGIEESCLLAAPTSCVKPLDARTALDMMVFQEISKAVESRASALASTASERASEVEAVADQVNTAETALQEAGVGSQAAAEAVLEACAREQESRVASQAAHMAKDAFGPELAKAIAERDDCAETLGNFVAYNIGCLELIRDGELPKKEKASPAEGASPHEEAWADGLAPPAP